MFEDFILFLKFSYELIQPNDSLVWLYYDSKNECIDEEF